MFVKGQPRIFINVLIEATCQQIANKLACLLVGDFVLEQHAISTKFLRCIVKLRNINDFPVNSIIDSGRKSISVVKTMLESNFTVSISFHKYYNLFIYLNTYIPTFSHRCDDIMATKHQIKYDS